MRIPESIIRSIAFVVLLIAGAPALAAPVYLECQLSGGGSGPNAEVYRWDITLNEDAGTVSYTIENGARVQNHPALFTVDEVSWTTLTQDGIMRGGGLTINRVDLRFTRHPIQIGDNPPRAGAVGQCRVVTAPRRAF